MKFQDESIGLWSPGDPDKHIPVGRDGKNYESVSRSAEHKMFNDYFNWELW